MFLKIKVILFLVVSSFIFGCNSKNDKSVGSTKPGFPPVAADVIICKASRLSSELELNGTIIANEFVELRPEISGRIVSLNIKEGSLVAKDMLIAKIFDEDLQAQLRKNQSLFAIAQSTESRLKKLLDQKGINQQDYDQALGQMNALSADIDFLKAQIRKTEIRSPFAGKIGLRQVSVGAFVSPQNVISTLQANSGLKVDFNVPENYANLIKIGANIGVVVEGRTNKISAKIAAIEPQINQNTRNLKVRAVLGVSDVQVGAFAKVLLSQVSRNSIQIPTNAIIPDTRNKKVFVFKNGKVQSVVVETGIRQNESVEILSGLTIGDTVAVSALLYLRPDAPSKVKNVIEN
ncbi:MAG: efflux RND transporter periplasmic adaptor subunit [Saprospiraceae bacterium]